MGKKKEKEKVRFVQFDKDPTMLPPTTISNQFPPFELKILWEGIEVYDIFTLEPVWNQFDVNKNIDSNNPNRIFVAGINNVSAVRSQRKSLILANESLPDKDKIVESYFLIGDKGFFESIHYKRAADYDPETQSPLERDQHILSPISNFLKIEVVYNKPE